MVGNRPKSPIFSYHYETQYFQRFEADFSTKKARPCVPLQDFLKIQTHGATVRSADPTHPEGLQNGAHRTPRPAHITRQRHTDRQQQREQQNGSKEQRAKRTEQNKAKSKAPEGNDRHRQPVHVNTIRQTNRHPERIQRPRECRSTRPAHTIRPPENIQHPGRNTDPRPPHCVSDQDTGQHTAPGRE